MPSARDTLTAMRRRLALLAIVATCLATSPPAEAQDAAARAQALEQSYRDTKVPKHLFNAAKLRQKSNAPARAANDYALYLQNAPEKEKKERASAQKELNTLGTKLGRFAIRATGATKLGVDGETVDPALAESWYVMPGKHSVEATFGKQVAKEEGVAVAGELVAVVVAQPPEVADTPPPPAPTGPGTAPVAKKSTDKFSLPPLADYIGGGVTVLLGGLTVRSAIDVQSQKDKFDQERSQANLEDGQSKQTRTNILLGVTAGFAVLTGVMAVVLVDWKRTDTKLGVGPGSLLLEGRF